MKAGKLAFIFFAMSAKFVELVPDNVSEKDMRDEVNRRTAKAGYTTRFGEPTYSTKIMTVIPFGKEKLNIWPRDQSGNLIE